MLYRFAPQLFRIGDAIGNEANKGSSQHHFQFVVLSSLTRFEGVTKPKRVERLLNSIERWERMLGSCSYSPPYQAGAHPTLSHRTPVEPADG